MKAERRHELQTNDLAQVSTKIIEKNKELLPRIGMGLLVVLVIVAGLTMWSSRSQAQKASAWASLADAKAKALPKSGDQRIREDLRIQLGIRSLKDFMTDHPGSDLSLWAQLDLADFYISNSRDKMLTEPASAREMVSDAQELYKNVFGSSDATTEMKNRAAIASGACLEMIGERAMAVEQYRTVAEQSSLESIKEEAARRADALEDESAIAFYKWYANYTPPALGSGEPQVTPPSFLNPDMNIGNEPTTEGDLPEVNPAVEPTLPSGGPTSEPEPSKGEAEKSVEPTPDPAVKPSPDPKAEKTPQSGSETKESKPTEEPKK